MIIAIYIIMIKNNKEQKWIRLRKDEYVFNEKIIRMTPKKRKLIREMDESVLHDKRYAV